MRRSQVHLVVKWCDGVNWVKREIVGSRYGAQGAVISTQAYGPDLTRVDWYVMWIAQNQHVAELVILGTNGHGGAMA